MTTKKSFLALGNQALREKKYTEAMAYYLQALQTVPNLQNVIVPNIERARQAYRRTRHAESRQKVAVCSWELSHNAAGRVYTLAQLYETFADVEIIGCHFPKWGREIWQPIRDTAIAKHTFVVEDEARFLEQAIELVVAHPYDIIHLSKPRAPNIFLGILYKLLWDAKVLMDIDEEELACVNADTPIDVDDYIKTHGALPALKDLTGQQWTRLAISLAKAFDGVTVSNPALQQRYGGEILRHARDEKRFISSLQYVIRQSTNCRLAQRFEKLGQYIGSTPLSSLFLINNKHSDYFLSRTHSAQKINLAKQISLKDVTLIKESGLFDEDWYRKIYPRVRMLQIDPVEHYLWIGARLRYNPSPQFNTMAYLEVNPDVGEAGINPLVHYARNGRREGRRIAPRRRAMNAAAWRQGVVPTISGAPSVLLCAHEVNEHMFGGERSFVDMLDALGQMKINVFITVPKEGNPDYIELLREKSSGLYSFPYGLWSKNCRPDETSIEDFVHIIEQRNIALVYCNTIVLVDPLIAARRAGRLTAIHARELIEHDEHLCKRIGLDAQAIVKRVLQQTDYVIANSAATQKLFAHSRRSFHAPNVARVDSLDMPNPVEDKVIFGIVSSNIPKKGIVDFVEVARRAEELMPNARFRVIGPENDYVAELKAVGLPSNLEFAGYADSPAVAMAQVNVVLSLSHVTESFGRTVAEAQAARRPVIAYRWGAVPELIDDGETGFLVGYKDIDAVVARVNKLCKEPELIATMGEAGREKILRQFSPVVLRNNLRHALSAILAGPVALRVDNTRRLTIIVPIYNAPDAVERCLQSVLTHTDLSRHRVLMINDGSSDERVQPLLERFARNPAFYLLVNARNIGYTCTINRGITWAGDDDILLLNSDTIVHDGWVEGMQKIAFGTPKAGTVTAMGDNSGAFSFPKPNVVNPKPEGMGYDAWAKRIIGFTQASDPIDVPTGNGFCMYIRRDLLDHIGLFDENAFPRGYGEENDFCMRAVKAGWKNFISPHAYIFHQRTASFGGEKEGLVKTAMEIINQRYPDYERKVKAAFGSGRMKMLRTLGAKACEDGPIPTQPTWRSASVGKPIADAAKYRVGPEKRFLSLNQMMIDWHDLRGQASRRDPNLVSIIVCVYNQHSLTNKCLNALVRHGGQAKIEIIMVNNASDEDTSGLLDNWAERDGRITVIHNFDNLNFSLGNNIGFAASHGARVVFLNNDTEVQPGWLDPLTASLADPEVMGAQPKLLYPDGRVQCVGVVFSGKTPLGYPIYVDEAADSALVAQNRRFRAITGACFAMRAADFAAVDGFDPVFINGQEDIDLCYRLGHGRYVFEYVAASTVIHHEGRTKGRGRLINHNRYTFAARWRDAFPGDDADFYEKDGFVVSEYLSERSESDEAEIACWRARIEVKLDAVGRKSISCLS